MANRYVRSLFWLCSFTGLGYGLLTLTSPSDSDIQQLKKELPGIEKNSRELLSKNQQFSKVLLAATDANKPLYRMSQKEIERELKK